MSEELKIEDMGEVENSDGELMEIKKASVPAHLAVLVQCAGIGEAYAAGMAVHTQEDKMVMLQIFCVMQSWCIANIDGFEPEMLWEALRKSEEVRNAVDLAHAKPKGEG